MNPSPHSRFASAAQPRRRNSRLRGQGGFGILQVLLGLAVAAAVAVTQIERLELDSQTQSGVAQGEILSNIRNAYNNYALENYPQLQNSLPITKAGVTLADGTAAGQTMAPTIANLVAMGYLPTGYSPTALLGSQPAGGAPSYQIALQRIPAGCVTIACNITGQVWINQPIWRVGTSTVAAAALGALTQKVGADAVYSTNAVPTQLVSMSGATFANPDATNRAGIVAVRVGIGSSGFGRFVLVDDPRDLRFFGSFDIRGDLGVGQSTAGATTCSLAQLLRTGQILTRSIACIQRTWMDGATGQIAAADAAGTARVLLDGNAGSLASLDALGATRSGLGFDGIGQSRVFADTLQNTVGNAALRADGSALSTQVVISGTGVVGAACATPNAGVWGTVGTSPVWLKCDSGVWQTTGSNTLGTAGGACPVNGATAITTGGVQLICENNVWISLASRMGKMAVFMMYRAIEGDFIPEPPCGASGAPRIFATPQAVDASMLYTNFYADLATGGWTVRIRDGAGGVLAGNVLVNAACWYP